MVWRTALLIGAIGGVAAAIGAPEDEPEGAGGNDAFVVEPRVVAPEPSPYVVLPWFRWDAPGAAAMSREANSMPLSTSVVHAEWQKPRFAGYEGQCRYRLFRPPDHAGPEYDDVYSSDVDDPGAAGAIKLAEPATTPAATSR